MLQPLTIGDVDRARPLWLALHAHHQTVAPDLAPYVCDDVSWRHRKEEYEEALADGGFGLVASHAGEDIGYLVCAKRPMQRAATFALPATLWELLSLSVMPDHRGAGVGAALLDAMEERVGASDVRTQLIGVIPDNERAAALYRSRGFTPIWLTLTRFCRPAPAREPSGAIPIERVSPEAAGSLAPLWFELHHHHQAVSPHLGPFASDAASWAIIEGLLEESARHGLLFAARRGEEIIGLASAVVHSAEATASYADTWATTGRIAETKFLVVARDARGSGVGTALMDTVEQELAVRGVADHLIGAIAPNRDAIGFYESRGFRPAWLELLKV